MSKAWVAMVIVNVHVFDFLIHLSKFAFYDISFKYLLKFKKTLNPGSFKKPMCFSEKPGWVGFFIKKKLFFFSNPGRYNINNQESSIDESMVQYFGFHSTKHFIKGKLIRYGYKI